jgi:PilZ domain
MKTRDSMVLIARPELTPALRERLSFDPSVLVFPAGEAANALSMIVNRNLQIVTLDRFFVSTPGGAKFVADVQTLSPDAQIRILEDEGSSVPLVLRRPLLSNGQDTIAAVSRPLRGIMRRAPRYPLPVGHEAIVDGLSTALVNLSVTGAQLVAPAALRPTQEVGVTLVDAETAINIRGAVAWSVFERSRKTGETCYRAGLEFVDAEPLLLQAYCAKYGIER